MNGPQNPFRVLLVEDSATDAGIVEMACAEAGARMQLHHVLDGIQALAFLRRETDAFADAPRPDLILLDLNMPRMNGREFLAEIKQDPDLKRIPVVVLTTSDADRDVAESYGLGASGFIVKPVDLDRFIQTVQAIETYWADIVKLP